MLQQRSLRKVAVLLCGLLCFPVSANATQPMNDNSKHPSNIVLIFVDNVGYGDLGCYGNANVKTPHIDTLAKEGVRCTDFYTASPSCSPSRAALLTGRYPARNGLTEQLSVKGNLGVGLRHSEILVSEFLRRAGYVTGCFGKWNIGFAKGSRPTERGFDEFFGHASGNMHYYHHEYNGRNDLFRGTKTVKVDGYSTDLFADAACDFIKRHAKRRFFCYVPFNAAHYPNPRNHKPGEPVLWPAPAKYFRMYGLTADEKDAKKRYRAVLTALDDGVGRILKQIDDSGLRDNTLVVFLSDNGAFMLPDRGREVASNHPLRSGGVTVWEGGVRVPCIVRWPGKLKAGSICREPLLSLDLLPLSLKAAGARLPRDHIIDGRDPLSALAGKAKSAHEYLFFEWRKMASVRWKKYKLVRERPGQAWQLYDLQNDIGETRNIASQHKAIVRQMEQRYDNWAKQVRE